MKKLSSFALILLLSCSHFHPEKKSESKSNLEALLSAEDLKIHRCLHSQKESGLELQKQCLMGTAYEGSINRAPSDDENDLVLKNNWFFGDNSKLDQFFDLSRGFVRAYQRHLKHATNDMGVGLDGSAFIGIGSGWLAEIVNHHGKVGLFCAPYVSLQTDVGVAAGISAVQSISCPSNQAYEGGFLSMGAGISGELIGLPVDLGASYSFGLDLPGFASRLQNSRRLGKIKISSLSSEVARLSSAQLKRGLTKGNVIRFSALMSLALKPIGILGVRTPSLSNIRSVNRVVRDAIQHHRSLGIQFKEYYRSYLSSFLTKNGMPHLNEFFSVLVSSMSGCDSVGGSAALSLSLSPASVVVHYENYALLMEMSFEDLMALPGVTPLGLLNPMLMTPGNLRAVTRVARKVLAIPAKIPRMCNRVFPRIR